MKALDLRDMKVKPLATDSLPENTILSTKKYGTFKINEANRPILIRKLEKMIDVIGKKNLLHLFPIVVGRDMTVIDGQHRLKAAQALNVPIYYIVSAQMHIEDAAGINAVVDRWTTADWLHHWCVLGLPEYRKLRDFHKHYTWMTLAMAKELCAGDGYGNRDGAFEKGLYAADSVELAETVAIMAMEFSRYIDFWRTRSFIRALRQLAMNPDYNHARMMKKLSYLSARLTRQVDVDGYMSVFNSLYNYSTADKNKVVLSANTHTKGKIR